MREKEKALSAEKNLAAVVRRRPPPPSPPTTPQKKKKKKKKKKLFVPPEEKCSSSAPPHLCGSRGGSPSSVRVLSQKSELPQESFAFSQCLSLDSLQSMLSTLFLVVALPPSAVGTSKTKQKNVAISSLLEDRVRSLDALLALLGVVVLDDGAEQRGLLGREGLDLVGLLLRGHGDWSFFFLIESPLFFLEKGGPVAEG